MGYLPSAHLAAYGASKAYVLSLPGLCGRSSATRAYGW
ncbi:MAG TPA: hypothetical protein VFG35_00735 [Actinoplanes sp.]|nr:hypothetical protein [Actinoplanes sp.]